MTDQDVIEDGKLEFNKQVEAEAIELGLIEPKEPKVVKEDKKEEVKIEREYTEVEKEQMALGWDPNKTGPKAVSAEEFKRVGEIIEAKRAASKRAESANKEVQELAKTVKSLVEYNRELKKSQIDNRLREVKEQRDEKISLGDVDGADRLILEEKVLEKAKETVDVKPVQEDSNQNIELTQEAKAYRDRNQFWLDGQSDEDKKMQILTNYVLQYLQATNPNISESAAIEAIESEVKQKFPHRFDNPNKEKAVAVGISSPSGKSKGSLSDLSYEEKLSFRKIKDLDPTFTEKEYLELIETTRGKK